MIPVGKTFSREFSTSERWAVSSTSFPLRISSRENFNSNRARSVGLELGTRVSMRPRSVAPTGIKTPSAPVTSRTTRAIIGLWR